MKIGKEIEKSRDGDKRRGNGTRVLLYRDDIRFFSI